MKGTRTTRYTLGILLVTFAACETAPTGPEAGPVMSTAKPGGNGGGGGGQPNSRESIRMLIHDVDPDGNAYDVTSDGKGEYADGICGVYAWRDGLDFMNPTAARIPKNQDCDGIAPRTAVLTVRTRHWADDLADHSQDGPISPDGTVVYPIEYPSLANIKFNPESAGATVNSHGACVHQTSSGNWSGLGLRLDSVGFPGSNSVIVTDHGDGVFEYATQPYPDNMAFCEDDTGTYFLHVSLRVTVSPNS